MSLKKELYYPVELGNDVYGNLTRIDNAIEIFQDTNLTETFDVDISFFL